MYIRILIPIQVLPALLVRSRDPPRIVIGSSSTGFKPQEGDEQGQFPNPKAVVVGFRRFREVFRSGWFKSSSCASVSLLADGDAATP